MGFHESFLFCCLLFTGDEGESFGAFVGSMVRAERVMNRSLAFPFPPVGTLREFQMQGAILG